MLLPGCRNPVVWSNRAACFLRLDNFEKALQDSQVRVLVLARLGFGLPGACSSGAT